MIRAVLDTSALYPFSLRHVYQGIEYISARAFLSMIVGQ
jgi:hypothetical protein